MRSSPTFRAFALVTIDKVFAHSVVLTRIRRTFIDIDVTSWTSPTFVTNTLVLVNMVLAFAVDARIRRALINVLVAVDSSVSRFTDARVLVDSVLTFSVHAR